MTRCTDESDCWMLPTVICTPIPGYFFGSIVNSAGGMNSFALGLEYVAGLQKADAEARVKYADKLKAETGQNDTCRASGRLSRPANNLGPGGSFKSMDAAAIDAIDFINWRSIEENVEYCGWIYQNPWSDEWYYTEPVTQEKVDECNCGSPPYFASNWGGQVAKYHTHGADSNGKFLDDQLSDQDLRFYINYVGTPSGSIWKFDPSKPAYIDPILPPYCPPSSNAVPMGMIWEDRH
jgi:hypothetical protein